MKASWVFVPGKQKGSRQKKKMRKQSRSFLLSFCLIAGMLLGGCTSFVGVDSLLASPQLAGDQQEIYNALVKSVTGDIQLVYPRTGSYKSAITLLDIDNEQTEEAIAFYELNSGATGQNASMPLRVNILDRREDRWVSVYDMGVDADEVEKIDLLYSDDGSIYLVVGYNYAAASDKQVKVYQFIDNILTVKQEFNALNYEVCDLDEDDGDEIVKLISVASPGKDGENTQSHVEAKLIQVRGRSFMDANQVLMYPPVTEYAQIHVGKLSDGKAAVFIDGMVGTQMVSEILYCDGSNYLKNLLYDGTEESLGSLALTQRSAGIYSMDVEGDGSYEIPQMLVAPGYEHKERYEQIYFTYWHSYSSSGSHRSYCSYTDFSLGYVFRMPSSWGDKVTAEVSAVDNEVTFYEYDPHTGERGTAILSIRVMSRSAYSTGEVSGKYQKLFISGQFVFLFDSHNDMSALSLSENHVRDSLYLLS